MGEGKVNKSQNKAADFRAQSAASSFKKRGLSFPLGQSSPREQFSEPLLAVEGAYHSQVQLLL